MYKKVLCVCLLIAFVSVQLATSLTCYHCTTEQDCKKPQLVTCTNATANETSYSLGYYHQNVPAINGSTRFDCLRIRYTQGTGSKKQVVNQIHGCVHPNVYACSLSLKPEYASNGWNKEYCNICSGDKCNKNPAATYSSSFYTILTTSLALILTKLYA
ncbi:uncharacterized protein LOC115626476 [Scaptodrosophila lebanonensis]|uniref:Uncharacterized protein LOC115626476 n=1 Tax=Drosophila lebanonensis TaxID=7225 RepID=A0A6J2TQD0_DROLE|nr:uncharacterized protein LOC115626476 [Scaptodrosophila lebanonensis]